MSPGSHRLPDRVIDRSDTSLLFTLKLMEIIRLSHYCCS